MVDKFPRVAVLLAAYNGGRWIAQQLDSILLQRVIDVDVFISVDASQDGTESLVDSLSVSDARIKKLPHGYSFGGAAANFFRLFREVDFRGYDYVALADQDDIWLEDKLITAHEKILEQGLSGYSGNVTAFWPDGRARLIDKAQKQKKYDFLFEAAGPGCSYVLKASDALLFKEFLLKNWSRANEVSLHDWLIYAWFRSSGLNWYIDSVPKMLYRQHGGNQVGANTGFKAMKARLALLRAGWYRSEISKIATLLRCQLPDVPSCLADSGKIPKLFLFCHLNQLRRRFRDRIFLALIVILGIY